MAPRAWLAGLLGLSLLRNAAAEVRALSDVDFEEATKEAQQGGSHPGWFVKFYAPWCGHCNELAPIFEKVAVELEAKQGTKFAKVDASSKSGEALRLRFKVRGFPTLILFKDAKMYQYPGDRSKADIMRWAQAGFQNTEAKNIPSPNITIDTAVVWIHDAVDKERSWWRWCAPVVAFIGLTFGLAIGANCCGPPPSSPSQSKQARLAREQREALREANKREVAENAHAHAQKLQKAETSENNNSPEAVPEQSGSKED